MKNNKGFTLIELIVVIVVLGILSVVAVPQFVDFAGDARKSTIAGTNGAIKSAVALTHSKALIEGLKAQEVATVNDVDIRYGYPDSTETGIVAALDISGEFTYNVVDQDNLAIVAEGYTYQEAANVADACQIIYTRAIAKGDKPVVVSETDGCIN
tara:strand:+ start:36569 stop:37033 length:465 start_codon:yes stop_codon:yes gene_type:complete